MTKFIQPSATAALLNRVTGGTAAQLHSALQANGKSFLIDPNGILIGPGSRIDTNGFFASALDVGDSQFMAGDDLKFSGASTAKVVNLGTIHAGAGDIFKKQLLPGIFPPAAQSPATEQWRIVCPSLGFTNSIREKPNKGDFKLNDSAKQPGFHRKGTEPFRSTVPLCLCGLRMVTFRTGVHPA